MNINNINDDIFKFIIMDGISSVFENIKYYTITALKSFSFAKLDKIDDVDLIIQAFEEVSKAIERGEFDIQKSLEKESIRIGPRKYNIVGSKLIDEEGEMFGLFVNGNIFRAEYIEDVKENVHYLNNSPAINDAFEREIDKKLYRLERHAHIESCGAVINTKGKQIGALIHKKSEK